LRNPLAKSLLPLADCLHTEDKHGTWVFCIARKVDDKPIAPLSNKHQYNFGLIDISFAVDLQVLSVNASETLQYK
jgi:hypothetical protein